MPPHRTPSTRSTSSQIVSSLRHRISNASLFLHKEESRAAKISVVVIVLVFACWLPFHAASLLHTPLFQVSYAAPHSLPCTPLPRPCSLPPPFPAPTNTSLLPCRCGYRGLPGAS